MKNENIQKDVEEWLVTRDEKLFNEKIYDVIRNIVFWKCTTISVTQYGFHALDDLIQELLGYIVLNLHKYKTGMGMTALSWITMLANQRLAYHYKLWHAEKRDFRITVYPDQIELIPKDEDTNWDILDYQIPESARINAIRNRLDDHSKIYRSYIARLLKRPHHYGFLNTLKKVYRLHCLTYVCENADELDLIEDKSVAKPHTIAGLRKNLYYVLLKDCRKYEATQWNKNEPMYHGPVNRAPEFSKLTQQEHYCRCVVCGVLPKNKTTELHVCADCLNNVFETFGNVEPVSLMDCNSDRRNTIVLRLTCRKCNRIREFNSQSGYWTAKNSNCACFYCSVGRKKIENKLAFEAA